jgi:hypothetical protein
MDKRIANIAKSMGAKHVATLPDVGGGAFGMARLAQLLHQRLAPSTGKRPGRPTNKKWTEQRKVPMSSGTLSALKALSSQLSSEERKISPMQLAAQLLEESVAGVIVKKGGASSAKRSAKQKT